MNKSFNNSVLWRKRNILNLLLRPRILNILDKKITQNNVLSMQNNFYSSYSSTLVKKKKTQFINKVSIRQKNLFPSLEVKNALHKFFLVKNNTFKQHIESIISDKVFSYNFSGCHVTTLFYRLLEENQSALFLAEDIVYYLEKRKQFSQIKNFILKQIEKKINSFFTCRIQGIRISCSGRLGGKSKKAQRSKTQTFKYGPTSLHVFSSNIDFAYKYANTAFGKIGIKVWISFN